LRRINFAAEYARMIAGGFWPCLDVTPAEKGRSRPPASLHCNPARRSSTYRIVCSVSPEDPSAAGRGDASAGGVNMGQRSASSPIDSRPSGGLSVWPTCLDASPLSHGSASPTRSGRPALHLVGRITRAGVAARNTASSDRVSRGGCAAACSARALPQLASGAPRTGCESCG
jgi:hypothetical protein